MLAKKNANSILALLSILLTFVLSEIFLQVTDFSYPSLYRLSEVVGVEHLPAITVYFLLIDTPRRLWLSTDHTGINWEHHDH